MSRTPNPVPTYTCSHHGYGRIYWRGSYRLLPGKYGSPESLKEFGRLCTIVAETGSLPPIKDTTSATIADLCSEFSAAMWRKYPSTSREPRAIDYGVQHLLDKYGERKVHSITALDIEHLKSDLIKIYCRGTVNRRIAHVIRAFRWGVTQGFVKADAAVAIMAIEKIRGGMDGSYDYPDVRPVDKDVFDKVMAIAGFRLQCMLRVHRATGMRPGELVAMTPEDVDMSQPDWIYRPAKHKTQNRGCDRIIGIPREIVPLLQSIMPEPHIPWFPIQVNSYYNLLQRACIRAGVTPFHPHRLRHTLATEVREVLSGEAAATMLSVTKRTVNTYAKVTPEGVRQIMTEMRRKSGGAS